MNSLACLIRSKRGQASQKRAEQSPQNANNKDDDTAVEQHATNDKGETVSSNGKLPEPPQLQLENLRRKIEHIKDILSQLNIFIAEELSVNEEADQKASSISTSIAIHLADLHSSAKALQAILKKKHLHKRIKTSQDTLVERPRGPARLPTPELGESFDGSPILHYEAAAYPDDESVVSLLPSLPPTLAPRQPAPGSDRASDFGAIAPLRLPQRSCSVDYSKSTDRSKTCSPFEKEMRDIDRQINESSQEVGRSHSTKPPSASLMHRRRLDLDIGTPCRRVVSLQTPRVLFDSPTIGEFCSEGVYSCSPLGSDTSFDERQFSTEAKTRRLRSLKRMSSPPIQQWAAEHTTSADNTTLDDREEEPLRMEELMDFLREGNSMRDL